MKMIIRIKINNSNNNNNNNGNNNNIHSQRLDISHHHPLNRTAETAALFERMGGAPSAAFACTMDPWGIVQVVRW